MPRPSRLSGVYTITCTANRFQYVGSSANVRNRWNAHRTALRYGKHWIVALQADWDTHGEAAFEFRTVAEIRDADLRHTAEQALIDRAIAGGRTYNRRPNVRDNTGYKYTDDQRAALSMALRGKPKSPEHRAKLSDAAKRRYAPVKGTPEMREQMAAMGRRNLGKPKSAEHRANIAKGQTALTPAQVEEIRSRRAAGGTTYASLAAEYGVHPGTIKNVVLRRHHYAT